MSACDHICHERKISIRWQKSDPREDLSPMGPFETGQSNCISRAKGISYGIRIIKIGSLQYMSRRNLVQFGLLSWAQGGPGPIILWIQWKHFCKIDDNHNFDLFWPDFRSKWPKIRLLGAHILHTSKLSSNDLNKQLSCDPLETFCKMAKSLQNPNLT